MTRDYICNGCRLNLIKTWCQKWLPFKRPERNCIISVLFLFREASELEIKVFLEFFQQRVQHVDHSHSETTRATESGGCSAQGRQLETFQAGLEVLRNGFKDRQGGRPSASSASPQCYRQRRPRNVRNVFFIRWRPG